jgi:hypothetical protein
MSEKTNKNSQREGFYALAFHHANPDFCNEVIRLDTRENEERLGRPLILGEVWAAAFTNLLAQGFVPVFDREGWWVKPCGCACCVTELTYGQLNCRRMEMAYDRERGRSDKHLEN